MKYEQEADHFRDAIYAKLDSMNIEPSDKFEIRNLLIDYGLNKYLHGLERGIEISEEKPFTSQATKQHIHEYKQS